MEPEAPASSRAPLARAPSPEQLRQRQRDRLLPRSRTSKENSRFATTIRDLQEVDGTEVRLSPAPKSKAAGRLSPDMTRKRRPTQDDVRDGNGVAARNDGSRDGGKFDITPDGGSAGRGGRQFTVANVGNNGKIYLRPTIRPANQRYPQPAFVFPITPPSTAGLDKIVARNAEDDSNRDSGWTSRRSPPPTPVKVAKDHSHDGAVEDSQTRPSHRRVHSYSTVDDQHGAVQDSDFGAFKIVIERPGTGRPKTAEETGGIPTLEVSIPSYKLGTPRFSVRGTPFLRGSSYAGTDDMRESVFSHGRQEFLHLDKSSLHPGAIPSRGYSQASSQLHLDVVGRHSLLQGLPSPTHTHRMPISPEMFDQLTFAPACDDPSLVRYSSAKTLGQRFITAATPARLVAEITAITDYELLADFFLTFRSFLSTTDLLAMLIARFRWALARNDEIGTVVRVRTFVALRHWILNYFLDDFALEFYTRLTFCELFNAFYDDVVAAELNGKEQWMKELGDLKICWRRKCSLYWDGPEEFSPILGPGIPLAPGGIPGSRDNQLRPSLWQGDGDETPRLSDAMFHNTASSTNNFLAAVSRAGQVESTFYRPKTPPEQAIVEDLVGPASPGSIMSDEVLSCSLPTKARMAQLGLHNTIGAHPVPASSIYESTVAHVPRHVGRPTQSHRRSGSFSDSLRDFRGDSIEKVVYKGTEILTVPHNGGSLVRGNLLPPGQAFVEVLVPSTPVGVRGTTYFNLMEARGQKPSAMSAPGMKKLLGTVRRALSSRTGPSASPTTAGFPQIGPKGVPMNRLPGPAVVPHGRAQYTGSRTPIRIDLLAAGILDDFRKAVRESADAESNGKKEVGDAASEMTIGKASGNEKVYPIIQMEDRVLEEPDRSWLTPNRAVVTSALTDGSKSIVIFDDTMPTLPVMTGALPVNPSSDSFGDDAFIPPSHGLTPPATPPDHAIGSPRRSSHIFGNDSYHPRRSLSLDMTPPPLVDDGNSASETFRSPSFREDVVRPSMRSYGKSFRSGKSISLRRYASYHSGFTRHQAERSFDASTFSGSTNPPSEPQPPAPLRVLRRRPGGDLRAATNVGELDSELRRPRSVGSLTTYSDSIRSSYLLGHDSTGNSPATNDVGTPQGKAATFSLGALAESSPKKQVSLFSTHSSQPVMRPSFEAEAAKLARIPDDANDDGGVESALLKLEGKYEQRKSDISSASQLERDSSPPALVAEDDHVHGAADAEKANRRHQHIIEAEPPQNSDNVGQESSRDLDKMLKPAVYQPSRPKVLAASSEHSYSSIPLLQRDSHNANLSKRQSRNWANMSVLRGPSQERGENEDAASESPHPSIDFVEDSESLRKIAPGHTQPRVTSGDVSFLEDDSDNDSALSSELSIEVISPADYNGDTERGDGVQAQEKYNENTPQLLQHAPSNPTIQVHTLMAPPAQQDRMLKLNREGKNLPPTPDITPTLANPAQDFAKRSWDNGGGSGQARPLHDSNQLSDQMSVHLPFIFAFESKILAQQFTLVEKECLNEIDWKELIEMRWKNNSPNARSWVNFLKNEGARGVDVVICRFNIMVNWATSEIVLTRSLEERVQTIIKYIHIAKHCRQYRNYATLYQITMALTSNVITRLTKTWQHVPAVDIATLRELEVLIQPTMNFHNLRAEMESAGGDKACIPFVGIYTHDLLFNSQRPSQIASTPTTEPLVNFERSRTSAAIVKNLLRLLESSQLYRYRELEGVTERCLWMAALSDDEIKKHGESME